MTKLEKALHTITEEYKLKLYKELKGMVNTVKCFDQMYEGRYYNFEIHTVLGKKDEIKVMIEASRKLFPINFFGRHKCFIIKPTGEVEDIEEATYWEEERKGDRGRS